MVGVATTLVNGRGGKKPATLTGSPGGRTMEKVKEKARKPRRGRTRRNPIEGWLALALPLIAGAGIGALEAASWFRKLSPTYKAMALVAVAVVARRSGERELYGAAMALAGKYGVERLLAAQAKKKAAAAGLPAPGQPQISTDAQQALDVYSPAGQAELQGAADAEMRQVLSDLGHPEDDEEEEEEEDDDVGELAYDDGILSELGELVTDDEEEAAYAN